jgi:uncharacterized protein (DUF427 family)
MGMMTGTGPLSRAPAGSWNIDVDAARALYIEPTPKRIRAVLRRETVADSTRVLLLSESGLQPVYYFPRADVRAELLAPSDRRTRCPKKGEASYHTVRVGDRSEEALAWYYPEPLEGVEAIRDHIAFDFQRIDHWFEEDQEIFGHAKDPYHRIDVYPSSRRIRVLLDGELLAQSRRALALFESNLPVRWYLPREDVRVELLPSETRTTCAYKGQAGYCSVRLADGRLIHDLLWYYPEPLHDGAPIKDLLCFFNERVELEVQGEAQEHPQTLCSGRASA